MAFRIETGGLPLRWNQIEEASFKVIVNVSDQYDLIEHQKAISLNILYHWLPMNEHSEMGFNSFIAALNVLALAREKNWPVLVHCHQGQNRSVMVKETYGWMCSAFDDTTYTPVLDKNCDGVRLPQKEVLKRMLTKFKNHLGYPGGFQSWLDFIKEK
jgi:hypothetical protein